MWVVGENSGRPEIQGLRGDGRGVFARVEGKELGARPRGRGWNDAEMLLRVRTSPFTLGQWLPAGGPEPAGGLWARKAGARCHAFC